MGGTKLEHLFVDEKYTKHTVEWASYIRSNAKEYANCRVVSFTRVKDLNSDWKHEYVQFIVEEITTLERTRVYAERDWMMYGGDYVTVGPVETKESGSKGEEDLPLPMTSLMFGGPTGDDNEQRPDVLSIAEILSATTIVGGRYSLFDKNCFWFATTTYDTLKRAVGTMAKEKAWTWFDVGGTGGGGLGDAWGLGWTTIFKGAYIGDAKEFKELREGHQLFGAPIVDNTEVSGVVVNKQKEAEGIEKILDMGDNLDKYIEALKDQSFDLNKDDIKKRLKMIEEHGDKVDVSDNLAENTQAQQAFVDEVLSAPDAQKYLSIYQSHRVPPEMDWDKSDEVPSSELEAMTVQALHVTVGKVLEEMEKQKAQYE